MYLTVGESFGENLTNDAKVRLFYSNCAVPPDKPLLHLKLTPGIKVEVRATTKMFILIQECKLLLCCQVHSQLQCNTYTNMRLCAVFAAAKIGMHDSQQHETHLLIIMEIKCWVLWKFNSGYLSPTGQSYLPSRIPEEGIPNNPLNQLSPVSLSSLPRSMNLSYPPSPFPLPNPPQDSASCRSDYGIYLPYPCQSAAAAHVLALRLHNVSASRLAGASLYPVSLADSDGCFSFFFSPAIFTFSPQISIFRQTPPLFFARLLSFCQTTLFSP